MLAPLHRTDDAHGNPGRAERYGEEDHRCEYRATLELVYSNIRAGRTAHEVAVEVKRGVKDVDEEIFRSGHFGYSIGLGFPPTWTDGPMYIAEGNHRVLEAGHDIPYAAFIPNTGEVRGRSE